MSDLRILVPYVGRNNEVSQTEDWPTGVHPRTHDALTAYAPDAEWVRLTSRVDAYYDLLAGAWADGQGFLLVEQDIEIHASVVPEARTCPEPWCTWPYPGPGFAGETGDPLLYESLGCVRFSSELLAAEPDLMDEVGGVSEGMPPRDWRRLDVTIAPRLRWRGYAAHRHWPAVVHHHRYSHGCSCGGTCD